MPIQVWCKTDKGLRRENNQDSYLVNPELGLYIVADGMGGHQGGEVASAIAVKTTEEVIEKYKNSKNPRDLLGFAYSQACERIYDKASENGGALLGMGTTMVCAFASGDSIYIGNVGDSRSYLFQKPFLWQVTEDHSLINEQLQAGIINEEQAKTFAQKNVITRSVGFEKYVTADVIERKLVAGDMYLFCSDGLSGMITDEHMEAIFNQNPPDKIVDICIREALASGGHDNVTVLLLQVL